jgi:hypothetical protein
MLSPHPFTLKQCQIHPLVEIKQRLRLILALSCFQRLAVKMTLSTAAAAAAALYPQHHS